MKPGLQYVLCFLSLPAITFAQPQPIASTTGGAVNVNAIAGQLAQLNHLPEGSWRVHAGDMPHGENPDLDDSSWPAGKPGADSSGQPVWFRQRITIPKMFHGYDLTGTKILFQFVGRATGGSSTETVFFDGRRVANGEDLEPAALFDHAVPGESVLVAVKLVATAGTRYDPVTTFPIEFSLARPNPDELGTEFLVLSYLVPSLSDNPQTDTATLAKAAGQVDLAALNTGNQQQFDDSLRASQATLAVLKPLVQKTTFHLVGNSHIDAAWLWPWTETVDVVRRTYSTALQLMREYPNYTFTQSAAAYNSWIAEKYPAMDDEIKERIREGRWEIVGGMWVEPDLNMPDGESIARSLLIGKRWYQQHYGVDVRIGWNPDSFGYNWQLPQIYKKSGIDYFVTQKMSWSDTNQMPFRLFWWESPDGSKILTYFPRGYANRNVSPVRLATNFAAARKYAPGTTELLDLYGVGDHGGGPTRAILDEAVRWMKPDPIVPKMEFSTAQSFFSDSEKKLATESPLWNYRAIGEGYHEPHVPPVGEISIPTWKDELYLETHRGVFTTQAAMKRNIRESVEWTLDAEKYAALAWLDGDPYPGSELTEAWKKIAFNDFHDLAAGSGIAEVYKDAQRDYDQVRWATDEISSQAMRTLAERVDTRVNSGVPVLIFNTLGWQRSGIVAVDVQMPLPAKDVSVLTADGRVLPSEVISSDAGVHTFHLLVETDSVPSMGYEVLRIVPEKRAFQSDLHVAGTTLENSVLRLTVDPNTGCISSLYDKKSKHESLAANSCGNELQAFNDNPKSFDAWNIDPGTLDQRPEIPHTDSIEVIEKGPFRGVIRVTRSLRNSKFVQDIELETGSNEVIVENDIDWHETHILLKAAIALSASSPFATYEIPYGTIERPTTRNNSWEKARFEVPALRWADLGDGQHGFSLINESKYGYDCAGNMLRLSLLRSPVYPDPNADQGHQSFSYALYPHPGDWKQALTVRRGYEFNYKLKAWQVDVHAGPLPPRHSFIAVSPENVVLTAIKKAEDSDALLFHMYEWAGKADSVTLTVPLGATRAVETDLLEHAQGSPLTMIADTVVVPIHPFEILVLQVDYTAKPPSSAR